MAFSYLDFLQCSLTGERVSKDELRNFSPKGAPLLACYDLTILKSEVSRDSLTGQSMWRYHALLPVADPAHIVTLGEGMTPLLDAPRMAARAKLDRLTIKDEANNPTGSFKARGSSTALSRAIELGARRFAIP